jgi:hypothetical protein
MKSSNRTKNRALERSRLRSASSLVNSSSDTGATAGGGDRSAAMHARELAYMLNEATSGKGIQYQRAVFQKLLEQPILQEGLPENARSREELEQCRASVGG